MGWGEEALDVHYRISIDVLCFALKWRDCKFIFKPRVLLRISVTEIETGLTERGKEIAIPLAIFPLLLPLQYPCWDEGGPDWRNGERRVDMREGVVAAAVTNIPGMDYGASP